MNISKFMLGWAFDSSDIEDGRFPKFSRKGTFALTFLGCWIFFSNGFLVTALGLLVLIMIAVNTYYDDKY